MRKRGGEGARGRRDEWTTGTRGRVRLRCFTLKGLNINSPGLSDEGALPRVKRSPPAAVRGRRLKKEVLLFRTEQTNIGRSASPATNPFWFIWVCNLTGVHAQ
ncbi:MAG: hypothetical protein M1445_01120 [Bacteroidetes bacterium]|nr:hypothetical protein [Bacteroidota bacterium]MCL6103683.1 hypothetical protein [Bacteroidota bacterium]